MADYARVLDSCLTNCGLPTREDGLSRTNWNNFRIWINHRIAQFWSRASFPFNTVTATLPVTVDVLPFPQQGVSDNPDIYKVLEVRDTSGNLKSYQDADNHLLFGPGGDDAIPFKVSVTYIKQPPEFPDKIWSSGLSVIEGDVLYWMEDGNFYKAHTDSTADEFNPGPSGPFNEVKITDDLRNVLAYSVAANYFLRNEDRTMFRDYESKAELEFSRLVQQSTTNKVQNRKTYKINY